MGADASAHVWLLYSGMTLAPLGDLWSDGWRFRVVSSYGRYDVVYGKTEYAAQTAGADVMLGYQRRFGDLWAKAFVGAAYVGLDAAAKDGSRRIEPEFGFKSAIELWLDIGDHAWASLDAAGTTAHTTFSVRARYGWRPYPPLSLGPEIILNGNDTWASSNGNAVSRALSNDSRVGGFIRFHWTGGEVSVSGGISGDISAPTRPYATLNFSMQY